MVPSASGACERSIDEPMLLHEREAIERGRSDRHVKVVTATGPIDDVDARRPGTPRSEAR